MKQSFLPSECHWKKRNFRIQEGTERRMSDLARLVWVYIHARRVPTV